MYSVIGAFDAKAHLSALLQSIKEGKKYIITLRGKPVADLIPHKDIANKDLEAAIAEMLAIEKVKAVPPDTIKNWINEGRE
jgi:prevent-host-death family protein